MKYLVILALLTLTSCGFGYQVDNVRVYNYQYACIDKKPLFFFDVVVKICTTKEECNDYCDKLRNILK